MPAEFSAENACLGGRAYFGRTGAEKAFSAMSNDSYHGIGVRRSAFAADLPRSSTRSSSIHQMWPELLLCGR